MNLDYSLLLGYNGVDRLIIPYSRGESIENALELLTNHKKG